MTAFWPICSGILLTLRTVLTSAACIYERVMKGNTYLQVVAGASHIYSETMQFREVKGIKTLDPFKSVKQKSKSYIGKDLAILHLNNSFTFNDLSLIHI